MNHPDAYQERSGKQPFGGTSDDIDAFLKDARARAGVTAGTGSPDAAQCALTSTEQRA